MGKNIFTPTAQDIDFFVSEIPKFFESSSKSGKPWKRIQIDARRYQVKKVGKECDICTQKYQRPVYKVVTAQYCRFLPPGAKEEKEEFEWIGSSCLHARFLLYKNGMTPPTKISDWFAKDAMKYSDAIRQFDDVKNLPSDIFVGVEE